VPLVLNVAAALWVVRLLAPDLSFLRPSRRPLDAAAVAAVVVTLLYLPGIVFVGMEHTLHMALVLAAVLAAEQRWAHPGDTRRAAAGRWAPYVLVGLAMLPPRETAGVVGGLAVALVVVGSGAGPTRTIPRRRGPSGAGPSPVSAGWRLPPSRRSPSPTSRSGSTPCRTRWCSRR
jgi:hypothetical protein